MIPLRMREFGGAFLIVAMLAIPLSAFEVTGWLDVNSAPPATLGDFAYSLGLHLLLGLTSVLIASIALWKTSRLSILGLSIGVFLACELGGVGAYWIAKSSWAPPTYTTAGKMVALAAAAAGVVVAAVFAVVVSRFLGSKWKSWIAGRAPILGLGVLIVYLFSIGVAAWRAYPQPLDVPSRANVADPERENLIIVLVDTLRKDHLSFFGYERPTSPNIDKLLHESFVFTAGYTPSNWTIPSVASLFTGLYPSSHAVHSGFERLPDRASLLSNHLRSYGYRTGAFIANFVLTGGTGYENGFETFFPAPAPWWIYHQRTAFERVAVRLQTPKDGSRGWRINKEALEFLGKNRDAPRFVYVHYLDPHSPYTPESIRLDAVAPEAPSGPDMPPLIQDYEDRLPDKTVRQWETMETSPSLPASELAGMIARYDGEIHLTDLRLGQFWAGMEELEILDRSHILFLTDHGEEFFDHQGWYHGHNMYEESIGSPMAYRPPGGLNDAQIIETPTQMLDLLYTVLLEMGIEPPESHQGMRVPEIQGDAAGPRFAFSERPPHLFTIRSGRWKLIQQDSRVRPEWRLFDMQADPGELDDLAAEMPDTLAFLQTLLTRKLVRIKRDQLDVTTTDDPQFRERLRSLGYIK